MAEKLQENGFTVYLYSSGEFMDQYLIESTPLAHCLPDEGKIALIIDELPSGTANVFHLMKSAKRWDLGTSGNWN